MVSANLFVGYFDEVWFGGVLTRKSLDTVKPASAVASDGAFLFYSFNTIYVSQFILAHERFHQVHPKR